MGKKFEMPLKGKVINSQEEAMRELRVNLQKSDVEGVIASFNVKGVIVNLKTTDTSSDFIEVVQKLLNSVNEKVDANLLKIMKENNIQINLVSKDLFDRETLAYTDVDTEIKDTIKANITIGIDLEHTKDIGSIFGFNRPLLLFIYDKVLLQEIGRIGHIAVRRGTKYSELETIYEEEKENLCNHLLGTLKDLTIEEFFADSYASSRLNITFSVNSPKMVNFLFDLATEGYK